MKSTSGRLLSASLVGTCLVALGCGGGGGGSSSGGVASSATFSSALSELTMSEARAKHTATVLDSGEVFVAGGMDATGAPLATTLLVTPEAVRVGPRLSTARSHHSATLLPSGRVLLAGGQGEDGILASSEVFDPLTGTVSAGPTLRQGRHCHAAFADANLEEVVVVGGATDKGAIDSAERVELSANRSVALASGLNVAQQNLRAVTLPSGQVLLAGGRNEQGPAQAELFDPAGDAFLALSASPARTGTALVARGETAFQSPGEGPAGFEGTATTYDDRSGTFSSRNLLRRTEAEAVVIGERLLVIGGRDLRGPRREVEQLKGQDLGSAILSTVGSLDTPRIGHTVVASRGKVLVIGGRDPNGVALASIDVIDPARIDPPPPPTPTPTPASTRPAATTGALTTPGNLNTPQAANSPTPSSGPSANTPSKTPGSSTPSSNTPSSSTPSSSTPSSSTPSSSTPASSTPSSSAPNGSVNLSPAQLQALLAAVAGAGNTNAGASTGSSNGGFSAAQLNQLASLLANANQGTSSTTPSSSSSSGSGNNLLGTISSVIGALGNIGNLANSGSSGSNPLGNIGGLIGNIGNILNGGGGSSSGSTGTSGNNPLGQIGGLIGNIGNLLGGGSSSTGSSGGSSSNPLGNIGGLIGNIGNLLGGGSSSSTGGSSGNPLGNIGGLIGNIGNLLGGGSSSGSSSSSSSGGGLGSLLSGVGSLFGGGSNSSSSSSSSSNPLSSIGNALGGLGGGFSFGL